MRFGSKKRGQSSFFSFGTLISCVLFFYMFHQLVTDQLSCVFRLHSGCGRSLPRPCLDIPEGLCGHLRGGHSAPQGLGGREGSRMLPLGESAFIKVIREFTDMSVFLLLSTNTSFTTMLHVNVSSGITFFE